MFAGCVCEQVNYGIGYNGVYQICIYMLQRLCSFQCQRTFHLAKTKTNSLPVYYFRVRTYVCVRMCLAKRTNGRLWQINLSDSTKEACQLKNVHADGGSLNNECLRCVNWVLTKVHFSCVFFRMAHIKIEAVRRKLYENFKFVRCCFRFPLPRFRSRFLFLFVFISPRRSCSSLCFCFSLWFVYMRMRAYVYGLACNKCCISWIYFIVLDHARMGMHETKITRIRYRTRKQNDWVALGLPGKRNLIWIAIIYLTGNRFQKHSQFNRIKTEDLRWL